MKIALAALAPIALLAGCASIVNGQTQVISIKTIAKGEDVDKCACTLLNNKGTWYVTSPGTVSVHRSFQDLQVTCKKDGLEPGIVAVKSSTKAMAFGNILFGGIIGAGVDSGTGAAFDYPPLIPVEMEQHTVYPLPTSKPATNAVPKASGASAGTDEKPK